MYSLKYWTYLGISDMQTKSTPSNCRKSRGERQYLSLPLLLLLLWILDFILRFTKSFVTQLAPFWPKYLSCDTEQAFNRCWWCWNAEEFWSNHWNGRNIDRWLFQNTRGWVSIGKHGVDRYFYTSDSTEVTNLDGLEELCISSLKNSSRFFFDWGSSVSSEDVTDSVAIDKESEAV